MSMLDGVGVNDRWIHAVRTSSRIGEEHIEGAARQLNQQGARIHRHLACTYASTSSIL